MNIFKHFGDVIKNLIQDLSEAGDLPTELDLTKVSVEPPRDASHGDIATNAAMVLSKQAKCNPRELATKIATVLEGVDDIEYVEVAGPGFINMRLSSTFWQACVGEILDAGIGYGASDMGAQTKVNVEYVSANPTGPLHVGHVRGAVFGDALANLLGKAGFDVTKEYYINDAGSQIDTLARSTHLRYQQALGRDIGEIPEGYYPGDYLVPVGEALAKEAGDKYLDAPESEWLEKFKRYASNKMMQLIQQDLAQLGINQDHFFSENDLHTSGGIETAIEFMKKEGLIYEGVLEPPKGKKPDDWEPRPQTLFKATDFGDDVDRALMKSDGSYTYFAADIAYHYNKVQRGFTQQIDVLGADHGGYVKRLKAAVTALSGGKSTLDVRLCQMVRLLKNGEPVKMSKRSGNFVTMQDVVNEVGRDVVRFIMLTRKNDAMLDFDFAKVTEQSKDNPVFYVQYAHARVNSVMGKAQAAFPNMNLDVDELAKADMSLLAADAEIDLIKAMAAWPRVVEQAAEAHEPHRVAFYLYDLASTFHSLWNKGNDEVDLRFIIDGNAEITKARLAMISSLATVIASGLGVLGVVPVKEMH
jgi:arginyl-tRNA synthetase